MIYAFETFELDTALYELRKEGTRIAVEPQVFDVLAYLIEHRDRLISKQELFENVWKTRFVTESALTSRIKAARRAVGDDGRTQRVIGTSHGRGYRFLAAVKEIAPTAVSTRTAGTLLQPWLRDDHLVGRHDELNRLRKQLEDALAGTRRTVVVTGEPGLGKSTLIETFLAGATNAYDLAVAKGNCLEQLGVAEPYMPILEALNRLCRTEGTSETVEILGRHAPTWLAELPGLLTESEFEVLRGRIVGATRTRMLREFVDVMGALAAKRPLILVLDDLQWSDPSTLDAVSALSRSPDQASILILCSCRTSEFIDPSHHAGLLLQELQERALCEELALPFLTEEEERDYLRSRVEARLLPERSEALLHARTGGNPLFMKTLVDEWIADSDVDANGRVSALGGFPSDTPISLKKNIGRRLEGLGSKQKEILETAAVSGTVASVALIATVLKADEEAVEAICDSLTRSQLFIRTVNMEPPNRASSTTIGFVHSVYQEVLYERVPTGRRIRLHGAIAQALEMAPTDKSNDREAQLAWHYTQAHDARNAVPYLQLAAGRALRRDAYKEAIGHLKIGLDLANELPTDEIAGLEVDLLDMLALALIVGEGWGHPEIESLLNRALALSKKREDLQRVSLILYHLSVMHDSHGRHDKSQELLEQRLSLEVSATDSTPLLESHELLACSMFHQGGYEKSLAHAEAGWSLYDPDRHLALIASAAGENLGVACMSWAALDLWFLGHTDRAVEYMRQALKLAEDPAHSYSLARAHEQTASLHQLRREPEIVLKHATTAIDLSRYQGHEFRAVTASILRGWAHVELGEADKGLAELQSRISDYEASGAEINLPYFIGLLAEAYLRVGRMEDCAHSVARALGRIVTGSFCYEAELHRLEGVALLRMQEKARGRESLRRALDIARAQKALSLELRTATDLAHYAGDGEEGKGARSMLLDVRSRFDKVSKTPDISEADRVLGRS